jgi:hypothetical protein
MNSSLASPSFELINKAPRTMEFMSMNAASDWRREQTRVNRKFRSLGTDSALGMA